MTAETDHLRPRTQDARVLHDSRETVQAIQFFIAAMAAQLEELDGRLGRIHLITTEPEFEDRLSQVEAERDQARTQIDTLTARLTDAEREIGKLQEELVRQNVSFADHHAAKQEIARLRSELEMMRHTSVTLPQPSQQSKRWWQIGKS